MGSLVGDVDGWQRRHRIVGFPVAVIRKFVEDAGGSQAALLSYYAFVATFPLLLVLVTVVEIVLRDNPTLQDRVLDSAVSEFPVVGEQLRDNIASLGGSSITIVLGLLVALIGARGVAITFQRVCNKLWGVPFVERPSIAQTALRTVSILALLGLGALSGALVVTFTSAVSLGRATQLASLALSFGLTAAMFVAVFRVATSHQVATRDLVRGALASAVVWQALLTVGAVLVGQQLRNASALYGAFGVVLGLLFIFVVQATATVLAIEVDVVRAKRLWPRSLTGSLTQADEAALADYVQRQRRNAAQAIHIHFQDLDLD